MDLLVSFVDKYFSYPLNILNHKYQYVYAT